MSICLISSIVQSIIPIVGVIIGTVKLLSAITLLKLDNSEDNIFLEKVLEIFSLGSKKVLGWNFFPIVAQVVG